MGHLTWVRLQHPREQRYSFLSVCAAFLYGQTMVGVPVFGIFNPFAAPRTSYDITVFRLRVPDWLFKVFAYSHATQSSPNAKFDLLSLFWRDWPWEETALVIQFTGSEKVNEHTMLMHATAHSQGCTNMVRESAPKTNPGRTKSLVTPGIKPPSVLHLAFQLWCSTSSAIPALKSDPGKEKIPRHTRESNLHQYCTWFFNFDALPAALSHPQLLSCWKHVDKAHVHLRFRSL